MTKASELRNLNQDDLQQKLRALSQDLVKLNYQKRIGGLDKPHQFRHIRKERARIKTVLREQALQKSETKEA